MSEQQTPICDMCKGKLVFDEGGNKIGEIVGAEEKENGIYVTLKLSIDSVLIYLLSPRNLAIKHLPK